MMAEKARLFADEVTRAKILSTRDASVIKKLGRQVRNFNSNVCVERAYKAGEREQRESQKEKTRYV